MIYANHTRVVTRASIDQAEAAAGTAGAGGAKHQGASGRKEARHETGPARRHPTIEEMTETDRVNIKNGAGKRAMKQALPDVSLNRRHFSSTLRLRATESPTAAQMGV